MVPTFCMPLGNEFGVTCGYTQEYHDTNQAKLGEKIGGHYEKWMQKFVPLADQSKLITSKWKVRDDIL
jgi:hypothetical protein